MNVYHKFIYLVVLVFLLLSCKSEDKDNKSLVRLFPEKALFSIGTNVFDIPLVTIIGNGQASDAIVPCKGGNSKTGCYSALLYNEIVQQTKTVQRPIPVSALRINIVGYDGFREETLKSYNIMRNELCPILPQQWARLNCVNFGENPLGKSSLRKMKLLHPQHIAVLKYSPILGSQKNPAELVKGLNLNKGKPERVCGIDEKGNTTSLGVVALKLANDLLVVWTISCNRPLQKRGNREQGTGNRKKE